MTIALLLLAWTLPGEKRLIEWGWDEPDPAFMRAHAAEMERTPFDGCVFHLNNFTWDVWGSRTFTAAELKGQVDDLKAAPFKRFSCNFLRFNTTPAKIDWFDDFAAVLANARLAATVAREGRCRGIMFDTEQYDGPLFDYRKQRDKATKDWAAYAAQARQRGREVMKAFQEGYPGIAVMLAFGHSLAWWQSDSGKKPLADCDYGLLAPFADGLVDACDAETRLVDGYELSYGFREAKQFDEAAKEIRSELLPMVADAEKYKKTVRLGFGLWMDNKKKEAPWDTADFTKNYFTPETFEASVKKALATADEFVWIYSERPRWWSKDGKAVELPEAYVGALRRAKE
jgi:hypothetical protein